MDKDNVFRSSPFFMNEGDILNIIIIDETGTPVTLDMVKKPDAGEVIEEVPGQVVVEAATSVTASSFSANWNFMENTTGYYLDVATDSAFTSFVAGFENKDVGNNNTYSVTGLYANRNYYYRLRAVNEVGLSENSEVITATTLTIISNDWFLPSRDELNAAYDELFLNGVGDLNGFYWSSSEYNADLAYSRRFYSGTTSNAYFKNDTDESFFLTHYVRAVRTFISGNSYDLRGWGESGIVFYAVDNGDSTFTYYEISESDLSISGSFYSNIKGTAIGTTGTAIGTGQTNTAAIIGQLGHTNSAAKLCDDLTL